MTKDEVIRELYVKYKDKIYGYLFNRLKHREDAEDLLSLVFTKIVENFDSYDASKASYSTWIYTITKNVLIGHYRKKKPETSDIDELFLESAEEAPEDLVLAANERRVLAECLATLSERDREIIIARYYYDYSFKKIGELMGMSEGNCRITHMRALEKLKKQMLLRETV